MHNFVVLQYKQFLKGKKKTEVKENNSYSSVLKHHRKFKLTYILHLKHLTYK